MKDGTLAELTKSGKYYTRVGIDLIEYYSLDGDYIPLASAQCNKCNDIVRSQRCGDYVTCSCGKVAVDTDRWMPEIHRCIGNSEDTIIST